MTKHKTNPDYDFHVYRCDMGRMLFGNSYVIVLAKSLKDAINTVPGARSVTQIDGKIIIRTDVAKDIIALSKEKWQK